MKRRASLDFLFIFPCVFAFLMVIIVPFGIGIYYSMTDWNGVNPIINFVGLKNFTGMFQEPQFMYSFLITLAYTAINVVFVNVVSFSLSLMVTSGLKLRNLYRAGFFVPNLIGGIILGYIWQLLLNGILLYFNRTLTYSSTYGFWGLIVLMCWQQIGYMMIIYIAGIQNISGDLIEAAKIDGANARQILRNVTIPMVMPSITICTFLTLTNSFKLFDQNLALTNGEPSKMSEMLALNIYNTFYGRTGWEGVGQAKAVVFFILVAIIALAQNKITRRKEVQQ